MNQLAHLPPENLPAVIETVEQALVMVERAALALAAATDFQATRKVRTTAIAAEALAREAKDPRLIEMSTELRARAERKAGQMLADSVKTGERAKRGETQQPERMSPDTTFAPILAQIGVTRDQCSKWQKVAALTDPEFEHALQLTKAVTHEISTPKVLRAVEKAKSREPDIIENDETPSPIEPRRPSHAEQATEFYNAVRALGELTCTARQLRAALPAYQHFRVAENVDRALALLQEVKTTWTN
jgi:hypothetical protein